jgi:hypothetical protein
VSHTPGPWAWLGKYGESTLRAATGDVLDYAGYEGMWFAAYDKDTDAANARLIAAAPDLLEALRLVVANPHSTVNAKIAQDAIAKATT